MAYIKQIALILIGVIWLGTMDLAAQLSDNDRKERSPKRHWFWDIFLGESDRDREDEIHVADNQVSLKLDLRGQWKFNIGDNEKWALKSYGDANWERIRVPSDWENDGFNGYDGYAWYRVHFDGRLLKPNQAHFLILGFIDDVDETFLNGKMIGKSGHFPARYRTAYNSYRKYYIPTEAINFKGDNIIAVRVYDEHANGGIVSGKPGIYVSKGSEQLLQNLYGQWKFSSRTSNAHSEVDYDDSHWDNLFVPTHWDNQGYRSFNGTAWYRKTFSLAFDPEEGKNYYLVLGKIDDFDITYLNGKKIGQTNDGKSFGPSTSYDKLRIYKIPNGVLHTSNENTIAVKVRDIGDFGGIYKGPVGIISEDDLARVVREN